MTENKTARRLQTEVRISYNPAPKFLDIRGSIAAAGIDGNYFPLWRPDESYIELRGADRYTRFGVTDSTFWNRCALTGSDSTEELLAFFFNQISAFAKPTRCYVASRYVGITPLTFTQMVDQFMGSSINRPFEFLKQYTVTDLGWLFDIDLSGATTLVKVGPMERNQILQYISDTEFSADEYFRRPEKHDIPEKAWFVGVTDQNGVKLENASFVDFVCSRLAAFDDFAENALVGLSQGDRV